MNFREKTKFFILRCICLLRGNHEYKLKRPITLHIFELYCERCGREFGMNTEVKSVLPLDRELKELHEELLQSENGYLI